MLNKSVRLALSSRVSNMVLRPVSTTSLKLQSTPPQTEDDVLFNAVGKRGLITLNRPRQLNAVNLSMILKLYPKLTEWSKTMDLIVIKGNSPKAFCAGGDVVDITKDKTGNAARDYFRHEYTNNGRIASLQIPYVALIHGIVMGGGVGLSIHGKYRVATETSLFAMPETQIGLFPDVGVAHFLARMPNSLGMFLALTGHRLKGFDLCHSGIATHFCHSELLKELEEELLKSNTKVDDVLQSFHSKSIPKLANARFTLEDKLYGIDEVFSAVTVEEIIERLEKKGDKFSQDILALLAKMSPMSLKITCEQIQRCASLDVYEALNQDFRLAWKVLADSDFYEGVRALLVDKDKSPKWKPQKLVDITSEQVDQYFKLLKPEEELNLPLSLEK